jgi:predicted metal-dependent hydrolase
MSTLLKYLQHYPAALQQQIQDLQDSGKLGQYLADRYPYQHTFQSDKALYNFCQEIKQSKIKSAPPLDKVQYDNRLTIDHHALGLNTAISRVQGGKLKAKKEIRVASAFKTAPLAFLRMIVVHELAHLKEHDHNKAFYKLCMHMEPDYHQIEFDCRVYLYWHSVNKAAVSNEKVINFTK